MRRLRQLALVIFAVLLSGGPGLAALAQTLCTPQRAMCPMCSRASMGLDCGGAERSAVHAMALRQIETVAIQLESDVRCFCASQDGTATVDAVVVSTTDGKVLAPAFSMDRIGWPTAPPTRFVSNRDIVAASGSPRVGAPLPLRV